MDSVTRQAIPLTGSDEEFERELSRFERRLRPPQASDGPFAKLLAKASGAIHGREHWMKEASSFVFHCWMGDKPDRPLRAIHALAPFVDSSLRRGDLKFAKSSFVNAASICVIANRLDQIARILEIAESDPRARSLHGDIAAACAEFGSANLTDRIHQEASAQRRPEILAWLSARQDRERLDSELPSGATPRTPPRM